MRSTTITCPSHPIDRAAWHCHQHQRRHRWDWDLVRPSAWNVPSLGAYVTCFLTVYQLPINNFLNIAFNTNVMFEIQNEKSNWITNLGTSLMVRPLDYPWASLSKFEVVVTDNNNMNFILDISSCFIIKRMVKQWLELRLLLISSWNVRFIIIV